MGDLRGSHAWMEHWWTETSKLWDRQDEHGGDSIFKCSAKALGCLTCPQDLGGMENLAGSRTESCPGKVAGVIFSHAGLIDST